MRTHRVGYAASFPPLFLLLLLLAGTGRADELPPIAERCRADLADRLQVEVGLVEVLAARPIEFPDASLGLPEPGAMYAQVVTPGHVLTLQAGGRRYVYAAAERYFRYGGPVGAWAFSVLRLEPDPTDPNLNGTLLRTSLVGTNPEVVLAGVTDAYPQADGSVLAVRRTSRSGQSLLYRGSGAEAQAVELDAAFAFGEARVDPDQPGAWVALVRERVGGPWAVAWGRYEGPPYPILREPIPDTVKVARFFLVDHRVILQDVAGGFHKLDKVPGEVDRLSWQPLEGFVPPDADDFVLNKSQTLDWRVEAADGKAVTQVSRRWFTGTEDVVARIPGLAAEQADLAPGQRFLLLSGRNEGRWDAVVVDVASGEVLRPVEGAREPPRLLRASPAAWGLLAPLVATE